ncbi:hypothetical protein [Marinobacter litoralis]|uniref:hypothetical protein n=1 Tax=Marinobacter litoralis TaxID=187981 RepID=UPI0018EDD178|nr:hypothetical protein [Marinobacter litoralis]MBJ6136063.1 hypothetical protein [Marinobacter litoralis]
MLLFVALQWRHIYRTFQFFVLLAIGLAITLWLNHKVTWPELAAAIDRSAFFTFFLTSLAVLREAAGSSPLVRRCGAIMVNQPPGRRYLLMAFGSHLFSVMLNVGALNVLGTMVKRAIHYGDTEEQRRIAGIRSRRMLTAVLRGFSGIPLWSPTSVTMLLVLSAIPSLQWEHYAPFGLLLAAVFILWGAVLDRISYPQRAISPGANHRLLYLLPLVLLVALIPSSAIVVSMLTGLQMFSALLMCVPFIGITWIAFQYKRSNAHLTGALVVRRVCRSFPITFTNQRNEVALFASSGFIGVILIPLIDPQWINHWLEQANIGNAWLMILVSMTILISSLLAINPIITVTLFLGVLQQLPDMSIPPTVQIIVISLTWAVFAGLSPFTAALRFIASFSSVSPAVFGIVWNGVFNLTVLFALYAALLIFL